MNNIITNKSTKRQNYQKKKKKRNTHEIFITLKITKKYEVIMKEQRKVLKVCTRLLQKTFQKLKREHGRKGIWKKRKKNMNEIVTEMLQKIR